MGGGIFIIFLCFMLGWLFGCIPSFTLLSLLRPAWPAWIRVFLMMMLATIGVVLVGWISAEQRNGWIFFTYVLVMALASVGGFLALCFRWLFRKVTDVPGGRH